MVGKSANRNEEFKDKTDHFLRLGRTLNFWDRGYDFPRRSRQIFGAIDLEGKSLLEIGCGAGLLSLWASLNGAKEVVALEPLEEGSGSFEESKIYAQFNKMVNALKLENININPDRIQDYKDQNKRFDIVLSIASVNHLDEDSCVHLEESEEAREIYKKIFLTVSGKMKKGGKFILLDCSKRNFFGDMGLTNPMEKSIEWFKHQRPEFWADLLSECGFTNPRISWPSGRILRYMRIYRTNKLFSYFLDSSFRLEMTRHA